MRLRRPRSSLFPYTTLFRSRGDGLGFDQVPLAEQGRAADGYGLAVHDGLHTPPGDGPEARRHRYIHARPGRSQIGRASCREKGETRVADGAITEEEVAMKDR